MKQALGFLLILIFLPQVTMSSDNFSVSEDFSSRDNIATGSAIVNTESGVVEPQLFIEDSNDSGLFDLSIDVGDGSHGAFNSSTYANFSLGGDVSGNVIRLDLNSYPELKVTSFTLDSGWTLRPVGDRPLIIKSIGTVSISGTIDCSGADGEAGTNVLADLSVVSNGGAGRCGGASGGNGASSTTAGTSGDSPGGSPLVAGSPGADNTASADGAGGGGGGGGYSPNLLFVGAPRAGETNGAGTGGAAGTSFEDNRLVNETGGAGGGGGGYANFGGAFGTGGGGGAGGGSIYILSRGDITVANTGLVDARGGDGGAGGGPGGIGGGGAGGTTWLASKGIITVDGLVTAEKGLSVGADDDGEGGQGRNFVADRGSTANGFTGNVANVLPGAFLAPGDTNYQYFDSGDTSDEFTVISKVLDSQSRSFIVESVSILAENPGNGSAILEVRAARDSDNVTSSEWKEVSGASSTDFTDSRYYQFRLTIQNSNATAPFRVTSITINFEKGQVQTFEFESDGGGCSAIVLPLSNLPSPPSKMPIPWLFLICLMPLMLMVLKTPHSRDSSR